MKSERNRSRRLVIASAALSSVGYASAALAAPPQVGKVFVIAMENHNWTQPGTYTGTQAIFGNANAPFINSLVTPGHLNAAQASYASNYINAGVGIHPSEPSYIWAEAGSNMGVLNDNPPYGTGGSNQTTPFHLSGFLSQAGVSWKSYQEDIDTDSTGAVAPLNQWTVPLSSRTGTYTTTANAYNGSKQYDYAPKHNPMLFFSDTNGGNNATNSNPQVSHYAPLQQLQTDLDNNTVARYNWISPNQFNDQHTALSGGYKPSFSANTLTGDSAQIAQGDDFLKTLVGKIMASQAYQNNGAIVIWNDESEGGDTSQYTLMEIVISPLAKGNAYNSTIQYSHSSDLRTMQEIFNVGSSDTASTGGIFLRGANSASDLSDMFVTGAIPNAASITVFVPEPSAFVLLTVAFPALFSRRRGR